MPPLYSTLCFKGQSKHTQNDVFNFGSSCKVAFKSAAPWINLDLLLAKDILSFKLLKWIIQKMRKSQLVFQKHHLFIDIFKRPILHLTLSESMVNFRERADPPCYPSYFNIYCAELFEGLYLCVYSSWMCWQSNVFQSINVLSLHFHAFMAIFRLHSQEKKLLCF